jgi:hypothetical protein
MREVVNCHWHQSSVSQYPEIMYDGRFLEIICNFSDGNMLVECKITTSWPREIRLS